MAEPTSTHASPSPATTNETDATGASTPRATPAWLRPAARMPATITLVVLLLAAGVVSQGLWSPFAGHGWFERVAYGLPAFAEGRWWTPITGTFFVIEPWVYAPTLLAFAGMGYLEWRRGSLVALRVFWLGQLVAILATALFIVALRPTGWPWVVGLAEVSDVGPSGGAMACVAAAVGLFAAPWRQRAWVLVFLYAAVSLLFLGTLADVEHAVAILLILAIDRSFRVQRTTIPEQRMLAVATIIALGAIAFIVLWLPTSGPFGDTTPEPFSLADAVIDLVIVSGAVLGLRKGRRWGWLLALLLVALNLLVAAIVALVLLLAPGEIAPYLGDADVALASGVLWAAYGVFLVATRRAFRLWRQRPLTQGTAPVTVDEVRDLIRAEGGGTLSWMTTWERMRYLRTDTGIVPYQRHAGVAIVLADPLGNPDGHAASIRAFVDAAERNALTPCFFSASDATRRAMPDGWRSLVIADDTIVDLEGLTFSGKAWSKVRQSFSRADREGMTFRLTRLADEPFAVRAQLQAISEQWVGDKGLPEMRFTLGTLQEAADPEVRLALAIDPQGNVDGMLSWLPVYGPAGDDGTPRVRGWTLDLMRRRDGGFGAVMEYLIGSSAKAFGDEGASMLSLSGAPLAHEASEDEGVIGELLGRLGALLEPVYGFRSLHRFKKKFNPRYEPIYLLYRDEGDLPAIGRGLTQAFLPDASLRQLASAGLGLVGSARTTS